MIATMSYARTRVLSAEMLIDLRSRLRADANEITGQRHLHRVPNSA